jgi:hypothetical protein
MTNKVIGFKAPENFRSMLKGMESITMENSSGTMMYLIWIGASRFIIDQADIISSRAYEKITQFYTSTLADPKLREKLYNIAYFMLRDKANFPAEMGPRGETTELSEDFLRRKNQYEFMKAEYPVNEKILGRHFREESKLAQEELSRLMIEKSIWEAIRDGVYAEEALERAEKQLAEIKKDSRVKVGGCQS